MSSILVAIQNENGFLIGELHTFFPNTSFPETGPEDSWMQENNVKRVIPNIEHNPLTHKLVESSPYLLESGEVCNVSVVSLSNNEIRELTVPKTISKFQAYAVLHKNNLISVIENYINNSEFPEINKIAWIYANEFNRDSEILNDTGKAIGLTESQIDDLFIEASTIKC